MKPILAVRTGTLSVNGSRFLAPKIVSSQEQLNPTGPLSFLGPIEPEYTPELPVDHKCHPRCQHACKPRCKGITIPQLCGCGGRGHSEAIRQQYHTLEDYGASSAPSSIPPLLVV